MIHGHDGWSSQKCCEQMRLRGADCRPGGGSLARGALWAEPRELPVVDMPRTGSPEGLQLGPKAPVFSGSCP